MTSDEYAAKVAALVREAKAAGTFYEDDHKIAGAYDALAEGAAKRCMGVGQMLYEVAPGVQRFEMRPAIDAIGECRQEALDVPAYLAQVAHLAGLEADADIQQGIHYAAMLMLTLDRLAARVDGNG
jgi:hypothetical protein